jgi:hypothetical protein
MHPSIVATVRAEHDDSIGRHIRRQRMHDSADMLVHQRHGLGIGIESAPPPAARQSR